MDLHLVVLPFVLAFSLASTNQCVSSPGSSIELSLHNLKNASGHWITTVDTRRFTMKENPRELTVNVHQETRLCDSNEIEQLVSVAFVYPSLTGYQLFPEFNCYKAFPSGDEKKTWSDARVQCRRDGGDLMVMETERERKDVFILLYNSVGWSNFPWVGVYIPPGGHGWMTVNGEPALSTWWAPGQPEKDSDLKCALAAPNGTLGNIHCAYRLPFICEIRL